MGDVPPPRLAPLRRPTLITDLPTDVLSYIISLVPGDETWNEDDHGSLPVHVRLSVVCRAFADAVRPPSAVWEDVRIVFQAEDEDSSGSWSDGEDDDDEAEGRGWCEWRNTTPSQQGAYGTLERAMQVAGPVVRRFSFAFYSHRDDVPSVRAWIERVLAATPRVHYAEVGYKFIVEGPPPMVSAGRAAILDFWTTLVGWRYIVGMSRQVYLDAVRALHRRLVAAGGQAGSGAARTVPVLTSMENLNLTRDPRVMEMDVQRLLPFIRSFAAGVGQHLTRLHLPKSPQGYSPQGVPACVDHLQHLRELHVGWCDDDPLDLRSVVTPPRGLTSLVVDSYTDKTVLLPPSIMARLEVMGVSRGVGREPPALMSRLEVMELSGRGGHERPPDCLRDAGNSFRRLTRLAYGGTTGGFVADLGWWATPAFAVPTLVVLEVAAPFFTLRAADGPAWAATVASTTLPRLERLALFHGQHRRSAFQKKRRMPTNAVAEAITHSLPAAAAAAGRSLSVRVQHWNFDRDSIAKLVDPHFDADRSDSVFNLTLKYEARPVR